MYQIMMTYSKSDFLTSVLTTNDLSESEQLEQRFVVSPVRGFDSTFILPHGLCVTRCHNAPTGPLP